ncbi:MAG: exodeoxyribonuclease III [Candidatus Falkowbacteria bacterium]
MKIISWNVNGIRAILKKNFLDFLVADRPDVLCLQEVKISESSKNDAQLDFPGYLEYWNCAKRPGYSGTAILVREDRAQPLKVINGFGFDKFDDEGRTQIAEFADFYLVNCYFPNSQPELSRLDYKIEFNQSLQKHLKKLEAKKPVIICGDFNVAHLDIDLARPKENIGNPGFTKEECAWMTDFLAAGFIDTYRAINKDKVQYTWWSYRAGARSRNVGWRIDYFCVSKKLLKAIKNAAILDKISGSDHCPVVLEL